MSHAHAEGQDEALSPIQIIQAATTPDDLGLVTHLLRPFDQGPAPHQHPGRRELCYVLEGVLAARRADEVVVLHAGEVLNTQAGVEHTYWNPTASPTRLLLIYTPGAAAETLHHLAQGEASSRPGPWDTS
ncbi:MAG: hypothetical protein OHK0015_30550 [Chloroflexi bacterium OHK40]